MNSCLEEIDLQVWVEVVWKRISNIIDLMIWLSGLKSSNKKEGLPSHKQYRLHCSFNNQDIHYPSQAISQDLKAHLCTDVFKCLHQEVCRPHPELPCAEDMIRRMTRSSLYARARPQECHAPRQSGHLGNFRHLIHVLVGARCFFRRAAHGAGANQNTFEC